MSLIKIQRYVQPIRNQLQMLVPGKQFFATRTLYNMRNKNASDPSESLIQKENLKFFEKYGKMKRNDIERLCQSFQMLPTNIYLKYDKTKMSDGQEVKKEHKNNAKEPCRRCEQIRNRVKKFLRSNFDTEIHDKKKVDGKLSTHKNQIRLHISKITPNTTVDKHGAHSALRMHINGTNPQEIANSDQSAIIDSNQKTISEIVKCFYCDPPAFREPPLRGPPIISPICKSANSGKDNETTLAPKGESQKSYPENIRKFTRNDRPRSLRLRRLLDGKEKIKETSVNEMKKHHNH